MTDERRIAVVGGGLAGAATAFFLAAERNARVTLVEREPRHDAHGSGRSAEILRVAADDPVTRALALQSSVLLDDPASIGLEVHAPLVDRRGLFVVSGPDAPAWAAPLVDAGAAERTSVDELRARAPHFTPTGSNVHWLPGGGRVHVARLLPALVRGAVRRGAAIARTAGEARVVVDGTAVRGVSAPGVAPIEADDVVVAAGAWTRETAASLGLSLPLRPTRRHACVTAPDPALDPRAPIVWDDVAGFYARQESGAWCVSACDVTDVDPAERPRYAPSEGALARVRELVARHLGDFAIARSWSGFRDLVPDDRPILGPDGRVEGLHWCAGLGGHGVTLSLAVGRAAAEAVLGRPDDLAQACSRARFETPVNA
ncbi:MAG: FAD-dependent oxidoreductase [Planctomycetota bacterium]